MGSSADIGEAQARVPAWPSRRHIAADRCGHARRPAKRYRSRALRRSTSAIARRGVRSSPRSNTSAGIPARSFRPLALSSEAGSASIWATSVGLLPSLSTDTVGRNVKLARYGRRRPRIGRPAGLRRLQTSTTLDGTQASSWSPPSTLSTTRRRRPTWPRWALPSRHRRSMVPSVRSDAVQA